MKIFPQFFLLEDSDKLQSFNYVSSDSCLVTEILLVLIRKCDQIIIYYYQIFPLMLPTSGLTIIAINCFTYKIVSGRNLGNFPAQFTELKMN